MKNKSGEFLNLRLKYWGQILSRKNFTLQSNRLRAQLERESYKSYKHESYKGEGEGTVGDCARHVWTLSYLSILAAMLGL